MREQDIQRQVLDFLAVKAKSGGLWFSKVPLGAMKVGQHNAPNPLRGFPDILCCYHGRMIAIEVKHPNKSHGNPETRIAQARVQDALRAAGARVLVADSVGLVVAFFQQIDAAKDKEAK